VPNNANKRRGRSSCGPDEFLCDAATARRRAISAIAAEDIEELSRSRYAAQRNLMRSIENATSAADIRQLLSLFAIEASRDYATRALRFDALVDEASAAETES
jgi:hypothetical protein